MDVAIGFSLDIRAHQAEVHVHIKERPLVVAHYVCGEHDGFVEISASDGDAQRVLVRLLGDFHQVTAIVATVPPAVWKQVQYVKG